MPPLRSTLSSCRCKQKRVSWGAMVRAGMLPCIWKPMLHGAKASPTMQCRARGAPSVLSMSLPTRLLQMWLLQKLPALANGCEIGSKDSECMSYSDSPARGTLPHPLRRAPPNRCSLTHGSLSLYTKMRQRCFAKIGSVNTEPNTMTCI